MVQPLDIQIRRSLTNTPTSLLYGEPAWDDNNEQLYIGNSSGTPVLINPSFDTIYQPLDDDLTSLASLTTTGLITRTATNTFLPRTLVGATNRIVITNGNGVAGNPTINISSVYVGQVSITTLGTITTGTWNGSAIAALYGGTGQTNYIIGDILYADTTSSLAKLPNIATGNVLLSGGVGAAPSYGKVGLNTHVSGVLPIANGGTGQDTATAAINALLPTQTGNTNFVLTTNGTVANWSAYTLQSAYNQSTTPEILTDATRGGINIRRGSTADTDIVFSIQNNAGQDNFTVLGTGTTYINSIAGTTSLNLGPSTTIADPNIATLPPTAYIETNTANNTGLRVYFNSGTATTSGYFNIGYDNTAPILTLVDMDDDPCFIEFSTARLDLSNPGPGTFAAPAIVNRFGARGGIAAATTGFSWRTNGGTSGGALNEIMSCDSNFLAIPSRTTANRPSTPTNGMIAYNSTLNKVESYENGAWTQYVDTTSNQTAIGGNKTFTGKISANTDIQQYFNTATVSTTSNVFAPIIGMSITTSNTVVSKYKVSIILAITHSTNTNTTVEIAIFNGITQDITYSYSQDDATIPISIHMEKIYTGVVSPTIFSIRWRRVSGSATVNVAYKSLIVQEIL